MSFCKNCGAEIPENSAFCTNCGTPVAPAEEPTAEAQAQPAYDAQYAAPEVEFVDPQDVQNNKALAILSYIGLLFIIPLVAAPNSKFAKFHANQGLLLFLFDIIMGIVAVIPFIGWLIAVAGSVASLVFMIMGIVNAAKGEAKELPLIGKYRIIK